ncbi:ATP synthase subunit a [Maioricimonas rarisocia]|uniref:ATP synthase subunit a n=1 Tax=Maioricimonas rarisocia TaxID=2528026 RepID=A0A517Z991_9PLAN|nr:F0F1 ATP synthase subunit A [Maioricimonas rarisocia]QDU39036.1 ATP synthase subunit a [Maioricimonas rarisocia]
MADRNFNITLSPDEVVWQVGPVALNATIVNTWVVMLLLVIVSRLVTRTLRGGTALSGGQNVLEIIVVTMRKQIREVSRQEPGPYLAFIGTLFLFIAVSNLLMVVPGFLPPTSSLSTSAALAVCVFLAVPIYGIANRGVGSYFSQYLQPSPLMLPFNIIGELSRTMALAVRLYGNMMSGSVIAAIILGFAPLFVPLLFNLFGLLTGMIQAYIFAILAMVYIASATRAHREEEQASTGPPHAAGRHAKHSN